jgi:hypothetical protein
MDVSSWHQLVELLTYHLTNFKLAWPYWLYWATDYVAEDESRKNAVAPNVPQSNDDNSMLFLSLIVDSLTRSAGPQVLTHIVTVFFFF